MGPAVVLLYNLLANNRFDVDRTEGKVVDDFGMVKKGRTIISVMPII